MEKDIFGNDTLTRDELHEQFTSKSGLEEIVHRAKEEGYTLHEYLELISPEPDYAENALSELLLREGLNLKPTKRKGTALVKDFMKKSQPHRQELFYAISDKVWEKYVGLDTLRQKTIADDVVFRDVNAAANTTANTAFQEPTNLGLYERNRFVPKLDINDFAWGTDTIDDVSFKQPEYTTESTAEGSNTIPEGGIIEVTLVSFAEVEGKTKKFGGGVAWTDEYALSDLRMSLIVMLMRRKGLRDRVKMVNEGLIGAMNLAASVTITLGSGDFDFDDIVEMALYDGESSTDPKNDYRVDTIFCNKSVAKRFIKAYGTTGEPGVFSTLPNQYFGSLFNGIQIINTGLGTPMRLGIVRDGAVPAIDNDTCLGVDTRWAAQFLEVAGSHTIEDNRISKNQITERYETRRVGWMYTDPAALANISV